MLLENSTERLTRPTAAIKFKFAKKQTISAKYNKAKYNKIS